MFSLGMRNPNQLPLACAIPKIENSPERRERRASPPQDLRFSSLFYSRRDGARTRRRGRHRYERLAYQANLCDTFSLMKEKIFS